MKAWLRLLIPSALFAAILVLFLQVEPFSRANPITDAFLFELKMEATGAGEARLYFDHGAGVRLLDSYAAKVQPGAQTVRFLIPPGEYNALRLEPLNQPGAVRIESMRVVSLHGTEARRFALDEWTARRPQDRFEPKDGRLLVAAGPGLGLGIRLSRTLVLQPPISPAAAALQFAVITALAALLLWKCGPALEARRPGATAALARFTAHCQAHPRLTLFTTAALAVIVSCHPLIFAGRSLVSPNNRAACLYDEFPTIPESPAADIEDPKGSDLGAMMWAHLPYSVVQHRAIFEHDELPLWNRYSACGNTLLGQGQSMIGDPLHWIPIAAAGASGSWDLKFILARLLFAFGVGLVVRAVIGRLGIATLLAASSAFLGFFAYRFNHAATFSLCYAPWILLGWLGIAQSAKWRAGFAPALLLLAANWMELHSGTAKESAMLIVGLNFTGALLLLLRAEPFAARLRKLAVAGAALFIFILLAAPSWVVFLDALSRAHTVSDKPRAFQISPAQVLGLFDDLFYRQTMQQELHTNPSANFLLLLGVLWAAVSVRRLAADRTFLALAIGALPPFALAFGIVPPRFIERLPFLGNISHIDNTFSCVLLALLFPLAAFGLRACRDRFASAEWRGDWVLTVLFAGLLAAFYFGSTQAVARADASVAEARAALSRSGFFCGYAPALLLSLVALPLAARSLFHTHRHLLTATLVALVALGTMHFRHAMYGRTKFDPYVMNPQPHVDLAAPSTAVEHVAARCEEPARVAGLGGVLVPGFNIVRGLEHFTGPDAVINAQHHELLTAAKIPTTWEWRHLVLKETYPALRRFYDLLGVRWLLGMPAEPLKQIEGLRFVGTRDLDVFESATAWPRAFFTDRISTYSKVEDFAAQVAGSDGRPFAAMQATDAAPSLGADQATRTIAPARNYQLTSNRTAFDITTPGAGLVVLGESWMDGDFRVKVNGQPAPCLRVNHAFKGVWVGKSGQHRVEFSYWPRRLTVALWAAALGAVFLCIFAFLALRFRAVE